MPILLSVVVPTINPHPHLDRLLSYKGFNNPKIEVVIVNQTGKTYSHQNCIKIVEILLLKKIPATTARNLGAQNAKGTYIFFLDDDAYIYSSDDSLDLLVNFIEQNSPDAVIVQRGETHDDRFISHWPKGKSTISYTNFSRFIIEWNIIIKMEIFNEVGGFINIGAGSENAALSGEVFVLSSMFLSLGYSFTIWPSISVTHPSLYQSSKPITTALGYYYGAGYSAGLCILKFKRIREKLYWLVRSIVAVLYDSSVRPIREIPMSIEHLNTRTIRLKTAKCRLFGLLDGIIRQKPRSLEWLDIVAKK